MIKYLLMYVAVVASSGLVFGDRDADDSENRLGRMILGEAMRKVSFVELLTLPEKYENQVVVTDGFLYVGGPRDFETWIFVSSEDMRLFRRLHGVMLAGDGIELPHDFMERNQGSFIAVQATVILERNPSSSGIQIVLKPNYIQILGARPNAAAESKKSGLDQ